MPGWEESVTHRGDNWANTAAYERYVGRWSRLVAQDFLQWLNLPPAADWLEIGCGTGAFTETILQGAQPATISGIDPSESFLAAAREHVQDTRVTFQTGNAMSIPLGNEMFDVVVSGLVLNFVPRPEVGLSEMWRVARRGGTVAVYVWDYTGEMQMMRYFWDAAEELDPGVADRIEGLRFPFCKPEPLVELFRGAGLTGVEVRAIDAPTNFRDFDDYWSPFLGGQGPAPGYAMSLTEEKRIALREQIRSQLPIEPDGTISLIARAWAIRGRK